MWFIGKDDKKINEFAAGEMCEDEFAELMNWIRERPAIIQELAIMFPPHCLVTARVSLRCPMKDEVAIVVSYSETGHVSVARKDGATRFFCNSDHIQVYGFYKNVDRESVRRAVMS